MYAHLYALRLYALVDPKQTLFDTITNIESWRYSGAYPWRGPALGGPESIDLTLHVFRDLVCVTIMFKTTVPSALALGASRTSNRSAGLADLGRWHRSRVPRVLVRAPRPSAVVSSRGLLRRRSAALAASRGCCTSRPMSSNVWQRSVARGRKIHACQSVSTNGLRASIWACMMDEF